jgi:hypothetical protein
MQECQTENHRKNRIVIYYYLYGVLMATTWIDQKTDKPAISWGLTLVNSIKAKSARHHNTFPLLKIAALALTCIILMFLYVLYVNKASTA